MTSTKKKVVKIYPTAECWCWAGEFCVFETGISSFYMLRKKTCKGYTLINE